MSFVAAVPWVGGWLGVGYTVSYSDHFTPCWVWVGGGTGVVYGGWGKGYVGGWVGRGETTGR